MEIIDFIEGRDWLLRDLDSYLYAPEYLVFFALAVLTAFILPLALRKKEHTTLKKGTDRAMAVPAYL